MYLIYTNLQIYVLVQPPNFLSFYQEVAYVLTFFVNTVRHKIIFTYVFQTHTLVRRQLAIHL